MMAYGEVAYGEEEMNAPMEKLEEIRHIKKTQNTREMHISNITMD